MFGLEKLSDKAISRCKVAGLLAAGAVSLGAGLLNLEQSNRNDQRAIDESRKSAAEEARKYIKDLLDKKDEE